MTRLIIDPSLFEVSEEMSKEDQLDHFMFLKESIDYVSNFFDACLDTYDGAPYCYNSQEALYVPPITTSFYVRNKYSEIRKKIQKMAEKGRNVDLPDKAVCECIIRFEPNSSCVTEFKKYLYYVLCSNCIDETLLLLSQKNRDLMPTITVCDEENLYNLASVYNPATNCTGIVSKYLKLCVDEKNVFPQSDACYKLNDCFLEEKLKQGQNIDEWRHLYTIFGTEVAKRNNYIRKPDLSRKNPNYEVYVHKIGLYYLSIDMEHGGLEIFKNRGKNPPHLGEFDFSCTFKKEPNPETHRLIV